MLALSLAAAPAGQRAKLTALTWTAPGREAAVLLEQPATCLDPGVSPADVTVGRALFAAPNLLGGQAERAAVSCASCHSNGRRNPAFFLAGISGEPGTADVSSSFFSLARANNAFDPKPIPDLAFPGKVSRDPASGALEKFIRGLVVDEFSGREPSAAELAGLAAYVRAVRACGAGQVEPLTLASDVALVRTSIAAARALLAQGDAAGAQVALKGARFRLGLIDERYTGSRHARLHRGLLEASRRLAAAPLQAQALAEWLVSFEQDLVPGLLKAERSSFYNRAELERWLTRP